MTDSRPRGRDALPVMVIGAGPVGLAAAANLAAREIPFGILEAGPQVGASVLEWGHVRLFSPWSLNVDPMARRLLDGYGWDAPDPGEHPTGEELVHRYLEPLVGAAATATGSYTSAWVAMAALSLAAGAVLATTVGPSTSGPAMSGSR